MMTDKQGHDIIGGKAENPRKKCSFNLFFSEECLDACSRIKYETGISPIGKYLNAFCKVTGDSITEYL
ncbi:MAG: hypothetical protein WA139_05715 [Candidatus Aenigmatarchaeota archaeon]